MKGNRNLKPCEGLIGSIRPRPADPVSSFIPHPSSLRILLWDIDGTLIHSLRRGAFKDYTIPMLEEVFGTAGRLPEMIVSGMTDLQIVEEALKHEGFTHADIFERVDHLRESYMTAMRQATGNGEQFFEVLPAYEKHCSFTIILAIVRRC